MSSGRPGRYSVILAPLDDERAVSRDAGWGQLASYLRDRAHVVVVHDRAELAAAARDPATVVVAPVLDGHQISPDAFVTMARGARLSRRILVRVPASGHNGSDLALLIRAGCDGILVGLGDDLRRGAERALSAAPTGAAAGLTLDGLSANAASVLALIARQAREHSSVSDLAHWLATHPRMLERNYRRLGWPTPSRLLAYGRLLTIAQAAANGVVRPYLVGGFASARQWRRTRARLLVDPGQPFTDESKCSVRAIVDSLCCRYPRLGR